MEPATFWAENKKTILTTVACVIAGLLVIKFFDLIFWGAIITALVVAVVLFTGSLKKKHGSLDAALKAMMAEIWGNKPDAPK